MLAKLSNARPENSLPILYVAYGLGIASNLALPGLPPRNKLDRIDLQIWLKQGAGSAPVFSAPPQNDTYTSSELAPDGPSSLRVGLLEGGKYYQFLYRDGARFAIDRDGRKIWADWPDGYTLEDACTYLVGPVIAFALRLRGITCLHASSIAVDDRAIVLLGAAGAGKSTTAAAFATLGYPVLSDDIAVLSDQPDGFLVQPGYPRVNLWPDSVRALLGSEDALPHITPTWDKRYLAVDRNGYRFQSQPLPLGAVYYLADRDESLAAPVVEDLTGSEALMTLVTNTYVNYLLDKEMQTGDFDVLGRVMAQVPVRRVRRPADPTKLSELCEAIAADARGLAMRGSARIILGAD